MDEWKTIGRHKNYDDSSEREVRSLSMQKNAEDRRILGRSRSATNILIKGFQYFSRANSVCRSNSSLTRDLSEDRLSDRTDFDEVPT